MIEFFTCLVGLHHTANSIPQSVQEALTNKNCRVHQLEPVLANAFEIGRRFKRLNPDKIRSEYGKLAMLLQDAKTNAELKETLGFKELVLPLRTVGDALSEIGATELLGDRRLQLATRPLPAGHSPEEAKKKEEARNAIILEWALAAESCASPAGTPTTATPGSKPAKAEEFKELLDRCLRSIDDELSFIEMNQLPIKKLIFWLDKYFKEETTGSNLSIRSGRNGACLTHSHSQQFHYVKEALTLWRIIHGDIFEFWETAETDLLNNTYRFQDTGQGFHRVSSGHLTYQRMGKAIRQAQVEMGGWVGSTVVHLGDNDVPNPLVFIDKYTIIPRLLSPIVQCIETIDLMFDESKNEAYPGIRKLILSGCKNHHELKIVILGDFFRHGFDGSGDDGGSCIDGRLTSAWNWCSELHKKPFHNVFLLTGFTGFDANYN